MGTSCNLVPAAAFSPEVSSSAGGRYAPRGRNEYCLRRLLCCEPVPEQVVDPRFCTALIGCNGGTHAFAQ